jgi:hypothetical protein
MTPVSLTQAASAIAAHGYRAALTLGLLWALAGCSGPSPKEWAINASSAQNNAIEAYLSGDNARYQVEAQLLRRTLGATAKTTLLTRAELSLCAAQLASLVEGSCPAYLPLSVDASLAEQAYEAFLRGDFEGLKAGQGAGIAVSHLPPLYRSIVENPSALTNKAFQDAPLSALVASGVLFRRGELSPEGVAQAVEIASDQGWRRPLLAWLGVQEALFKAAGKPQLAQGVRRRIDMATK